MAARRQQRFALCLWLCACLVGFASSAQAAEKRLVVLLAPGLRADDLLAPELAAMRRAFPRFAAGWMNARAARVSGLADNRIPPEAACLTLGAGSRAAAREWAQNPDAQTPERLKAANARLDHPVPIGALGDLLRRAGISTAVLGNEDEEAPRCAARLLAMDSQGSIVHDLTGPEASLRDERAPYGKVSNLALFQRGGSARFQTLVFGDLIRAERYAPFCLPAVAAQHRRNALRRLDQAFAACLAALAPQDGLWILAPTPSLTAGAGDRLAPILLLGGGATPGWLTSGSTQRRGLVTNTDFLPAVARFFGLPALPGMVGRPFFTAAPGEAITPERWRSLHRHFAARAAQQAAFGGLPTLQLLVLAAATAVFWLSSRRRFAFAASLSPALALVPLALPLTQLLLPALHDGPIWRCALLLGGAILLIVLPCRNPVRAQKMGIALCGALAACILLDLARGGLWMREAWMGYSVMEGARYYGIGNEYAGAAFAGALLFAGTALSGGRLRLWPLTLLWLALLAALIGLPTRGANLGGLLGAALGIGAAGLLWRRGSLRARDATAVFLACWLALGAILLFDALRGAQEQTHIARALTDGGNGLWNIIYRKAALNAGLLVRSPWALALAGSVGGIALLWRLPDSSLRRRWAEDRAFRGMAAGLITGAASLLIFNDSGVVAAAAALLPVWAMALLTTDDRRRTTDDGRRTTR